MVAIRKRHHRSQPFAVATAGAAPTAQPSDLGGSNGGASSIPFGFIPALDYVPSFQRRDSSRGDERWNEKVLTNPPKDFPRVK